MAKSPRKVTSNMAPEGGATYEYANPNYTKHELPDYVPPAGDLLTRLRQINIDQGLVWEEGNEAGNRSGRWVRPA